MKIGVLAQNIVTVIMKDLNGRKGFDLGDLEGDTLYEIRRKWRELVQAEIDKDPK